MKIAARSIIVLLIITLAIAGLCLAKNVPGASGSTITTQFTYTLSASDAKNKTPFRQGFVVSGSKREVLFVSLDRKGDGIFEEYTMGLSSQFLRMGRAGVKKYIELADGIQLERDSSYKVMLSYDRLTGEVSVRLTCISDGTVYYEGYIPVGKSNERLEAKVDSIATGVNIKWTSVVPTYIRSGLPENCGDELGAYLSVDDEVFGRGEAEISLNKPENPLKGSLELAVYDNGSKKAFALPIKDLPFQKRVQIADLKPGRYRASLDYIDSGYRVRLAVDDFQYWAGKFYSVLEIPEERPWITDGLVSGELRLRSFVSSGSTDVTVWANTQGSKEELMIYQKRYSDVTEKGLSIPISFKPARTDAPLSFRVGISTERGVKVVNVVRYLKREFFVSPMGSDSWTGRVAEPVSGGTDGPFATLDRAKAAIEELRENGGLPKGGVTVWIRGGTYRLGSTFTLTEYDSGEKASPIVYKAYKGEKPVISGGHAISGFSPYNGQILKADLSSQGVQVVGPMGTMSRGNSDLPSAELFYKGERQTLARWPNKNSARDGEWAYTSVATPGVTDRFGYTGDKPRTWKSLKNAGAVIWPSVNWHDEIIPISGIDTDKKMIMLEGDTEYEILPGRRFYIQGILEELDSPGEWYIDQETGTLYFWSSEPIKSNEVVISTVDKGIEIAGCSYLTLQGLTFESFRGTAISVNGGHSVKVAKCVIRNTGGNGIEIAGGTDNGIAGCDIYETGRGGIILSGGERVSLTRGNNYADNNHIHHYGRLIKCYQAGINVSGVGNRLSHNLIHDGPHNAILLSGNEHLIEYNEIHHVCMEGADSGAFYMGRDWSMRGNVLRYNYFHDISGYGLQNEDSRRGPWIYESPHAAWAIYLDDCASGTTVFGNIFVRVPLGAVMIGGGRDNVVENNIIVDSSPAVHLDARWDEYPHYYTTQKDALEAINYKEAPYADRYPSLVKIYDSDPRVPSGNSIVRNVIKYTDDNWRGSWNMSTGKSNAILWEFQNYAPDAFTVDNNIIWHDGKPIRVDVSRYLKQGGVSSFSKWQEAGFDIHSIVDDPLLIEVQSGSYNVSKDSVAYRAGFEEIPSDIIGLYEDDLRASWPIDPDTRKDGLTLVRERVVAGE